MQGFKVILTPQSIDDLRETVSFIAQHNPERARTFGYELIDQALSLATFPDSGTAREANRKSNGNRDRRSPILMKLAILTAVAGAFSAAARVAGFIAYDEPTISRACRCKTGGVRRET